MFSVRRPSNTHEEIMDRKLTTSHEARMQVATLAPELAMGGGKSGTAPDATLHLPFQRWKAQCAASAILFLKRTRVFKQISLVFHVQSPISFIRCMNF